MKKAEIDFIDGAF